MPVSLLFMLADLCQSTGTDTEKMVTHILKMILQSLAQYHSVPTSVLENNSQACIGN